jgi:hypothetical protein
VYNLEGTLLFRTQVVENRKRFMMTGSLVSSNVRAVGSDGTDAVYATTGGETFSFDQNGQQFVYTAVNAFHFIETGSGDNVSGTFITKFTVNANGETTANVSVEDFGCTG